MRPVRLPPPHRRPDGVAKSAAPTARPNHSRVDRLADTHGVLQAAGVDIRGKAILRVVDPTEQLIFVVPCTHMEPQCMSSSTFPARRGPGSNRRRDRYSLRLPLPSS
jgi:hypothetical protein